MLYFVLLCVTARRQPIRTECTAHSVSLPFSYTSFKTHPVRNLLLLLTKSLTRFCFFLFSTVHGVKCDGVRRRCLPETEPGSLWSQQPSVCPALVRPPRSHHPVHCSRQAAVREASSLRCGEARCDVRTGRAWAGPPFVETYGRCARAATRGCEAWPPCWSGQHCC